MEQRASFKHQLHVERHFAVRFISILVACHGIFTLSAALLDQIAVRRGTHVSSADFDVPLLLGLSLIYLSTLLRRQKRTAWLVALVAYAAYFLLGLTGSLSPLHHHAIDFDSLDVVKVFILPLAVVGLLLVFRRQYVVRSDIQGFRSAARFSVIILLVALLYGTIGIQLFDKPDFHQEIGWMTAAHYTVDQFNLTTSHPLHPYTKRARLFVGSLSFVSLVAIGYAGISLFQPLRSRFNDQTANRARVRQLLKEYGAPSEDYFKLWPADKQYYFDSQGESVLAFHVKSGVALCVADPVGRPERFPELLRDFNRLCFGNDWLPALIHVAPQHRQLYEDQGFTLQKLGEEAVLDLEHFQAKVVGNKYFRHIRNKFTRQGFSCELLRAPHHAAVLARLHTISEQWLSQGGRVERGFVMGYYSKAYIQQCAVMIVRDAAGTIQAFLNVIPANFDEAEATFDILRHASGSPGNINDFLLINLISELQSQGYKRLNLGLSPLVGLDDTDQDKKGVVDGFLRFAYANGDRFYSFSGLHRFKAKYEPQWHDRYVAYQGGVRGFSRTMTALMRAMRVKT